MSVEEILMGRRTVEGCTAEVWSARKAAEEKKKAEVVADRISTLMLVSENMINELVEKLREVRKQEDSIKKELNAIGRPFLYAQDGLYGDNISIGQIAPLVDVLGKNLADYSLEDADVDVPEDFTPKKS